MIGARFASGPRAARLAGRVADGLIVASPSRELVDVFGEAGGEEKPVFGEMAVAWAEDDETATRTVLEWWPIAGLSGDLLNELRLPRQFENAVANVTEAAVAKRVVCGPDPSRHLAAIQAYAEAGCDHVCVMQCGPDHDGFFDFYEEQVLSRLGD
jgi:G6PDH family F420-dependent oxidoreductase